MSIAGCFGGKLSEAFEIEVSSIALFHNRLNLRPTNVLS